MISYVARYMANLDSRGPTGRRAEDRVDHSSQLLKGVLDMCLLSLIAEEPSYGF